MPVVTLPWDVDDTYTNNTSGAAAYIGPNGQARADVYVGLDLDGYTKYRNISEQRPDIKMNFFEKPTLSCPSDQTFNPGKNERLSILVRSYAIAVGCACATGDIANKNDCK
jgi:hypothetical protein